MRVVVNVRLIYRELNSIQMARRGEKEYQKWDYSLHIEKHKRKVIKMNILSKVNIIKLRKNYGEIDDVINTKEYREFRSEEEAEAWGKERYGKWAKQYKEIFKLTSKYDNKLLHVVEPADMYLGYKYIEMNGVLREEAAYDSVSKEIAGYIGNLMMAIFSAPVIGEKVILYRLVPKLMVEELVFHNKKGRPYVEKGFLSTSMVKECCEKHCGSSNYMLKIYVDDETPIHAIFANAIRVRSEEELLLPPKMYMRMVKYPYVDEATGKIVYEVRLINMVW